MGTNFSWGNDEIQLDIKPLEEKIQNNTNDINTLKTTKLDVSVFNTYKITNDNKINNVINELNNSTLINYQGEWVGGTALLGQVWSYNNDMWLCKVSSTTQTPTVGNDWDLLSAPEIDLSNYYDKAEINSKFANYYSSAEIDTQQNIQNQNINANSNNINQIKTNLSTTNGKVENNTNNIANIQQRIETINTTLNNKQNTLRLTTQPRNVDITNFTFTGNYLDGKPIYEGVLEFEGQGEANLVNNCTLLLVAYLYDISQNKFISPENVNLRVVNGYQIRASLPSTTRRYRLYFVGTKNG